MSSFAGVSVINGRKLCTTSVSAVDAGADRGYHLLVVKDYSRAVRELSYGAFISSEPFMVGGHQWAIRYYPNGHELDCDDFIYLGVFLCDDNIEDHVDVKFEFSFIDDVEKQKPKYIRASETCTFSDELRSWSSEFVERDVLKRSAHLKGDSFTIRCDIMVCNTKDVDGALSDVHEHFDYLLKNKVGANVTFEVSGETFAAHRCVLAARSKVFKAQLFGPMTEDTTASVIQIKDMKAKVFTALLSFIYTDSFPNMDKDTSTEEEEEQNEEEEIEHVMWLQDLFVAADRYGLQRLKFLCEKQFSEDICVSSVASTLALAEQHHCHELKENCFKFIQVQSPECMDEVMAADNWKNKIATNPSVLNELVAKLVCKKGEKRKH